MNRRDITLKENMTTIKRVVFFIIQHFQGCLADGKRISVSLTVLVFLFIPSCQPAFAQTASFYGNGERLNKYTANREVFNPRAMTCASYYYKFNTLLKVTNLKNNKSVIVRVNDRGPNKRLHRAIDLTKYAFLQIASLDKGIIEVKIEKVN